jgi:protein O-mannosyl-transferase
MKTTRRGPRAVPRGQAPTPAPPSSGSPPDWRLRAFALLPVLAASAAFAPAVAGDFVDWDDFDNFLENRAYRGLGWAQVCWAWTTFHVGVYQPLGWMLLGAQYALWGLDPRGYHVVSLLLHAANAAALYAVCVALLSRCRPEGGGERPWSPRRGSALAAALFMAHPQRAEVVAWASCQTYLPCALFALLSVLAYLHAHPEGRPARVGWGVGAFGLFVAALLCKAAAVGLPLVLLILDVYPLRRWGGARGFSGPEARRAWVEKLPYFALSLVFTVLALEARAHARDLLGVVADQGTPAARAAQACYGAWFYLAKALWPVGLSAYYPLPATIAWSDPPFLLAGLLLVGVTAALIAGRRRWPALLAGWISYLAILAPSSGLVRAGGQIAADRYSYLPLMGPVVLAAAGLARLAAHRGRRRATLGVAAAALAVLVALSWRQCLTWRSSTALWGHALALAADPPPELLNYHGAALGRAGRAEASLDDFRRATLAAPDYAEARRNLGAALVQLGRLDEAEAQLAAAVRLRPDDPLARSNLADLLLRRGRDAQAAGQLAEAVRLCPDDPARRATLGALLLRLGRLDEAARQLAEAVRLDPDQADARANLGVALARRGRLADAEAQLVAALRLRPDHFDAHNNLAIVRARQGRLDEAESLFRRAQQLRPDSPAPRDGLAEVARLRAGRPSP